MSNRAASLFREVHRLALAYHWPESEILRMSRARRQRYLGLLEADEDADLFGGLLG